MHIFARGSAKIFGDSKAWGLEAADGSPGRVCEVRLELQGDEKHGFILVMDPAGCFAADHWYERESDARADARELFGVRDSDWTDEMPST